MFSKQFIKGVTQKGIHFHHFSRKLAAGSFACLNTGLEALSNDPKNKTDIKKYVWIPNVIL